MKKLVRTLCFSLLLFGSGCGTMISHMGECGRSQHEVYMGTRFDAACMAAPFAGEKDMIGYIPIAAVDLPLSLTLDTIIFPLDLTLYIKFKDTEKETPSQPDTAPKPTPTTQ